MANALVTPSMIAKESIMQLDNSLVAAQQVYRDYKEEYAKIGDTINVRRPVQFTVTSGSTASFQDVEEGTIPIVMNQQKNVAWYFQTSDLTLTIEEYSERYVKPAMIQLANKIDSDILALYKGVWNWVGTPGQVVNAFDDFSKGPARLDEGAVPTDSRSGVLAPADFWAMVGSQTNLYQPEKVKTSYEKAKLGDVAGISTFQAQNVQAHTVGTKAGTPLVNGASQNVTYAASKNTNSQSLVTDGWTASSAILKQGDVFTLAGVYAVNPVTKVALAYLQQFVVNADISADGSGNATLNISPAIITSGPYQTVSAAPADNAAITVLGTASTSYLQNMIFHKNAFALVSRPMELPDGAAFKAKESYKGMSVRVVKDYDLTNDRDMIRIDVLYGVKAIDPRLATRLSGT